MKKELVIGLFGFGVVGEGLYKILQQTPSLKAKIKKACIVDTQKKRNAPKELFTTDKNELLFDDEINVIVEVINDADAAFQIVSTALRNNKDVVSASKKMISEHLPELLELQKQTGRSFLYEAAACASIPVIRNLEEYYDNDLLHSFSAILNGSTNYILTKMYDENVSFDKALTTAQELGYAETDPKMDIEGFDAAHKLTLLLNHAYGIVTSMDNISFLGVQNIDLSDISVAKEKKWRIKLVATAKTLSNGKIATFVFPQFVSEKHHFSFVKNEFNGVIIESGFADQQFFYGKGAGSLATGSGVMSDVAALRYGYKYEYKKLYHHDKKEISNDFYLRVYVSFNDISQINKDDFEWIEEWHGGSQRNYLIGVLHFDKLQQSDWWQKKEVSLILCADAVIEDIKANKIKKSNFLF